MKNHATFCFIVRRLCISERCYIPRQQHQVLLKILPVHLVWLLQALAQMTLHGVKALPAAANTNVAHQIPAR